MFLLTVFYHCNIVEGNLELEGLMMNRLTLLQKNADSIKQIIHHYGAENVRVFGSAAHQSDTKNSDIDLLIEWNNKHSLFDYIDLQQQLENLLQVKVDLVVEKELHW